MKLDVLNQTGQNVGQIEANEAIFKAPVNSALVAQAVRVRLANARVGTATTKDRAEVRGGGRKPWRQKGTGRARQGSIRAPQWRGGGIVHGPQSRIIALAMPKRMRRQALFSSLTDKVNQKQLIVLEAINLPEAKTSQLEDVLKALSVSRSALVILPAKAETVEKSARNIQGVKVTTARVLHAYDVMRFQTVIIIKDSLDVLDQTFIASSAKGKVPSAKTNDKVAKEAKAEKAVADNAATKKSTAKKAVEAKPAKAKTAKVEEAAEAKE